MRTPVLLSFALLAATHATFAAEKLTANAAFNRLKQLAGEWKGNVTTPDGPAATVQYRLTSAGQTVMETLFPGTSHEMISMYHLDGEELVMTHYCAMGNQPRMKLDAKISTADEFHFAFAGGSNLKPAKDAHMHSGVMRFRGADKLESEWQVFSEGKPNGS